MALQIGNGNLEATEDRVKIYCLLHFLRRKATIVPEKRVYTHLFCESRNLASFLVHYTVSNNTSVFLTSCGSIGMSTISSWFAAISVVAAQPLMSLLLQLLLLLLRDPR